MALDGSNGPMIALASKPQIPGPVCPASSRFPHEAKTACADFRPPPLWPMQDPTTTARGDG